MLWNFVAKSTALDIHYINKLFDTYCGQKCNHSLFIQKHLIKLAIVIFFRVLLDRKFC